MTARTIDLFPAAFGQLRAGRATVALPDSEGQRVFLFSARRWPSSRIPTPQPSVVLSDVDLDLIESEPEGLVVVDTTRMMGWTIRIGGQR